MWMLLCRPITIPVTKVSDQTMISTDKCRIVTVSPPIIKVDTSLI